MYTYTGIQIVTQTEALGIIESRTPHGLFVQPSGDIIIGIDNCDGNAWVEEFTRLEDCLSWLTNEKEYQRSSTKEWFGTVRWCDSDLRSVLIEKDIDATDANVSLLRRELERGHYFKDTMVERGWDVIYSTLDQLFHP